MPARNSTKPYVENGYYHIYNRGVEKRAIFQDEQDYSVLLSYLKDYLLPKNIEELTGILAISTASWRDKDKAIKLLRLNNFHGEITLLAYCLMPNHFHFLVKQRGNYSIDKFMQSLCTRYTMFFNRKHKRIGPLFQSVYKAVLIVSDEQLLHLTRYIHKQALASQGETLRNQPCSYPEYLGVRKTLWLQPQEILAFFSTTNPALSYKSFVSQQEDTAFIQKLIIEDE